MRYSIKYLESISGIRAHTIRIWEQRYGLLKPRRTSSNIRYYDDEQLRKLLNITSLLKAGHKPAEIAGLSEPEVNRLLLVYYDRHEDGAYDRYINELIIAGLAFNRAVFESLFSSCVLKFGFATTVEEVLYPVLKRVGVWWQSADMNPSQEHFISGVARQKLFSAIDGLPVPQGEKRKCLLFLPQGEHHEIGLLYFYFLLLKAGIPAVYLGADVPFESLRHAVSETSPAYLVFFRVKVVAAAVANRYQAELHKAFPGQTVLVAGHEEFGKGLKLKEGQHFFDSPASAKQFLKIPD